MVPLLRSAQDRQPSQRRLSGVQMGLDQPLVVGAFVAQRDASDLGSHIPIGRPSFWPGPLATLHLDPMPSNRNAVLQTVVAIAEFNATAIADVE